MINSWKYGFHVRENVITKNNRYELIFTIYTLSNSKDKTFFLQTCSKKTKKCEIMQIMEWNYKILYTYSFYIYILPIKFIF